MGINPALAPVIGLAFIFKCMAERKTSKEDFYFFAATASFFLAWGIISSRYDSLENYSTIDWRDVPLSLGNLAVNLIREYLHIYRLLLLCIFFLCARLCWSMATSCQMGPRALLAMEIIAYCLISAILLAFMVSANHWVRMNQCAPRYLAFSVFSCILACSIGFAAFFGDRMAWPQSVRYIKIAGAIMLLCFFWPKSFNLYKAEVYEKCDASVATSDNFYLGDYWQIWACVSRDLNWRNTSYAIGLRSASDRENIEKALDERIAASGAAQAFCLGAGADDCARQLEEFNKKYIAASPKKIGENILSLRIFLRE